MTSMNERSPMTRLASSLRSRSRGLLDRCRDLASGLDTAGIVEPAALEVRGPHRDRGVRYQATHEGEFLSLLQRLDLPRDAAFVDVGCGKGRVLMLARRWGFRSVTGIDYAPALCDIARRNLARDARRAPGTPVHVHCIDAADYDFGDDAQVIYLFNPFDALVLGAMLARLAQSLRRAPRRAWLVYLFPRWHESITAQGVFRLASVQRIGASEFAVFEHGGAAS